MHALTHASGFCGFLSMVLRMNLSRLCCGAAANRISTSLDNPVLTIHSSALGFPVVHGLTVDLAVDDASRRCSSKRDGVRLLAGDVSRPAVLLADVAAALLSATTAGGKVNIVSLDATAPGRNRRCRLEIVSLRG